MPNVDLIKLDRVSPFRKVAIGTWQTAYDPTVYGSLELRTEAVERYIDVYRAATKKHLTMTHIVTKAVARALSECKDANAILRFNRIYLRRSVDVSVLVVIPSADGSKVDLSAAVVRHADQITLAEQIDQLETQVGGIRKGQDKALQKTKDTMKRIPFLFMNTFLKILAFLMYDLNLDLSAFGVPRDQFGGATVTNVGSLGLDLAWVPLVPYSRVPIWLAPGVVHDKAVVENGKVVPGRVMMLNASFDHRFIDGYHAMVLSRTIRKIFADPFAELDPIPGTPTLV